MGRVGSCYCGHCPLQFAIKPLTHKTKNRVANHGAVWWRMDMKDGAWLLEEVKPKNPKEPYSFWGTPGVDFEGGEL